jgi:NhaP-type Na+/H+ or K+/H+ antiporter
VNVTDGIALVGQSIAARELNRPSRKQHFNSTVVKQKTGFGSSRRLAAARKRPTVGSAAHAVKLRLGGREADEREGAPAAEPNASSVTFTNTQLHHGDELLPEEGGEEQSYVPIYGLNFFVCLGAALLYCTSRHIVWIPYPCMLFVAGFTIGVLNVYHSSVRPHYAVGTLFMSVGMWESLSPHMIFYTFLPPLVFCDAMKLNVQLFKLCFGQILLLACPGVLMGTGLTAAFSYYVLPCGWGWPMAFVFGSILSATDPVACVAIFSSLGVSPRLTMVVEGESLLNDGSAMLIFSLALKVAFGVTFTGAEIGMFVANMLITSLLVGGCFGCMAVYVFGLVSGSYRQQDSMIQLIITFACAYLSFFVAEHEFETSGILSTVMAGGVVANFAWPRFVSREMIETVWEAIEFVANTVLFLIGGAIFADKLLLHREILSIRDFGYLALLYIAMIAIRGIMVMFLWRPMSMVGKKLNWKECVAMVWSGLRGSISIGMALMVASSPGIDARTSSEMIFYVGGVATLTTLLNAVSTAALLNKLGLVKPTRLQARVLAQYKVALASKTTDMQKMLTQHGDPRFDASGVGAVGKMMDHVEREGDSGILVDPPDPREDDPAELKLECKRIYREMFLRFVKNQYWKSVDQGIIDRNERTTRWLLHSCDQAKEDTASLCDWAILSGYCVSEEDNWLFSMYNSFSFGSSSSHEQRLCRVALCFLAAHTAAREELPRFFGTGDKLDQQVEEEVVKESRQACKQAEERLKSLPLDLVKVTKCKMLAWKLLHTKREQVELLHEDGVLAEKEADALTSDLGTAMRLLRDKNTNDWLDKLHNKSNTPSCLGPRTSSH